MEIPLGSATAPAPRPPHTTRLYELSPDSQGRTPDDPDYYPFGGRDPDRATKMRAERETQVATEERCKRWVARRYAVESLPRTERWGRRLLGSIERWNAQRDPTKYPPQLLFKGDEAVKAGASDEQIEALPTLTPDAISELREREATQLEAARIRVRIMARKLVAEGTVTPPEPTGLDALLSEDDEDAEYRIGELWPHGGRVLLAAQYKSGKSTLVGNVIRALVDGDRFLDRFDVIPVGRIALIDTELDRRTLRRWLRDQDIRKTTAVTVQPLRGAASAFDILDPTTRSEWAARLAGTDVVILDCLRPILDALGLSEDKDAGRVLVAFDALLAEIGANEGMVVTHMGHQQERARGDSRLLDWPDALWKIVRGGDKDSDDADLPRYLSAIGRDVALPEGQLTYDTATRHLTYAGGSRKESNALAALPELIAMVRLEPGALSKNAAEARLKDDHGISQKAARAAINRAIRDGSITAVPGPHNAKLLSPGPDPFTPRRG